MIRVDDMLWTDKVACYSDMTERLKRDLAETERRIKLDLPDFEGVYVGKGIARQLEQAKRDYIKDILKSIKEL
jgi:hypothetical protein